MRQRLPALTAHVICICSSRCSSEFQILKHGLKTSSKAAISTAALAVLGMSTVTGGIDHTPILPVDIREWREFIEYAASIAFSYATGIVLGNMSRLRKRAEIFRQQDGIQTALTHLVLNGANNTAKLQKTIKQFNDVSSTLTAAATTAAAMYTGLQGFLK
jgi:hypothetical protein